ncbi:hypothetical protein BDDG_12096 [Blastomyces dermatitidis ATCC 18188]|uniref:Uncharacterized protein n=1 Tax=Ajellomyces dermatitidis (strain ATCC 18188 / CBS 674.68) TaxID=653446 RepID=A0A0J9EMS9_AJEDA|nr:hypothetical protein BDDG_12096 [Blastomyces dermatitidis ATCC 18188]
MIVYSVFPHYCCCRVSDALGLRAPLALAFLGHKTVTSVTHKESPSYYGVQVHSRQTCCCVVPVLPPSRPPSLPRSAIDSIIPPAETSPFDSLFLRRERSTLNVHP